MKKKKEKTGKEDKKQDINKREKIINMLSRKTKTETSIYR